MKYILHMDEDDYPNPKEVHNKYFPDERFDIKVRYSASDGHDHDPEDWIGSIPRNTPYLTITCARGWNSDTWERMQEAYENEGYETYLKKSSGTTETRSGTSHHAATQLFVW